jgi:hypothetical protein
MADYTTTELIAKMKLNGMVPTAQSTFSASDFLRFLNDEVLHYIVPMIMSVRQEYFVASEDTVMGSTTSFNIPERAIGTKIRDILKVTTGGNQYSIPRLEPEDVDEFNNNIANGEAFYLQNDSIILKGINNSNDTLRTKFFRRPNELVATSACALVSSVSGNIATCSSIPTTWTTSMLFDVIKGKKSFISKGDDQTVTDINTTTNEITFTVIPTGVVAGDWICLAQESPIPQIPYDCFPLLIMKTTASILRSLGQDKDAEQKEKKIAEMKESIVGLLADRTEGEPRKLVNKDNFAADNSIRRKYY